MEAKELRIGNLILAEDKVIDIGIIKEKFISWNIAKYPENKVWNPFISINDERLKNIPITDLWKEKIKDNENLLINVSGFIIFKNGYAYQFIFEDYPFVHSIQNLYFALTGSELTIN